MRKVNNRRLIGDGYSYSPLAREQNLKRFPALIYPAIASQKDSTEMFREFVLEEHSANCVSVSKDANLTIGAIKFEN